MSKKKQKTNTNALAVVTPPTEDIKIRVSRNDILELCLTEARKRIDDAFDLQRQKCVDLRRAVTQVQGAVQKEATELMKKRFAKVIRACATDDKDPHVTVQVVWASGAQVVSHGKTETRVSYLSQFRLAHTRVESVKIEFGFGESRYESWKCTGYCFEACVLARDLDATLPSITAVEEAIRALHTAADRLDALQEEQRVFKQRSANAKQVLLKKILSASEKGREILAFAQDLSVDVHTALPKEAAQTRTIDT
ncbi:hypothetical protein Rctr197k_120 [Virus Rctr197k]|nr:hypothetical protein Rctr197k_120 [Virus Rctr197k]